MTDISSYLIGLSKVLVVSSTERERIDKSFGHLKEKIWGVFQDKLRSVVLFGSYDRETVLPSFADKNTDVDVLIIFNENEFQPQTYLNQLKSFSEKTYPRSDVFPDHPTVVVELEHVKFELVPAIVKSDFWDNESLHIPGSPTKETKWIETDPNSFKKKLIEKHKEKNNQTIPIIKIFKYWNALNDYPFSSYTMEKVAVNDNVSGSNLKECLYDFISELSDYEMNTVQKKVYASLVERKRKLKLLDEGNAPEYLTQELSAFIPMPNEIFI